jgi:hypothetical protein
MTDISKTSFKDYIMVHESVIEDIDRQLEEMMSQKQARDAHVGGMKRAEDETKDSQAKHPKGSKVVLSGNRIATVTGHNGTTVNTDLGDHHMTKVRALKENEEIVESFTVKNAAGKVVHTAYSENAARAKAIELSKSGEKHTSGFDRQAMVKESDDLEHLEEGWKKEDSRSNEKTNRDRVGMAVSAPNGNGTIHVERKRPTFSRLVPYAHEITVKYDDGTISSHPAKSVKMLKTKTSKDLEEATLTHHSADWDNRSTKYNSVKHHGKDGAGADVYTAVHENGHHTALVVKGGKLVASTMEKTSEAIKARAKKAVDSKKTHYWDTPGDSWYNAHRSGGAPKANHVEIHESVFDWRKNMKDAAKKSNTTKTSGGLVNKGTYGSEDHRAPNTVNKPKEKQSVGRPAGAYGGAYKIDKGARDSQEYKDALSAKVRAAKAQGFEDRSYFKDLMNASLLKHAQYLAKKAEVESKNK